MNAQDPEEPFTVEERNRLILRRTLSAISALYAAWSFLVGWSYLALPARGEGLQGSRPLGIYSMVQGAFYAGACLALWRPLRAAWTLTFLAGGSSLLLAALDLLGRRWQSAVPDGAYGVIAVAILLQVRERT